VRQVYPLAGRSGEVLVRMGVLVSPLCSGSRKYRIISRRAPWFYLQSGVSKKKPLLPGDGSNSCLISMTPKVVLGRTTGLLELFALSNFMVSSHLSVRRNLGGLGNLLKEHLEVSGNPEFIYIRKDVSQIRENIDFFVQHPLLFGPPGAPCSGRLSTELNPSYLTGLGIGDCVAI
jgi:hypothetical protein